MWRGENHGRPAVAFSLGSFVIWGQGCESRPGPVDALLGIERLPPPDRAEEMKLETRDWRSFKHLVDFLLQTFVRF